MSTGECLALVSGASLRDRCSLRALEIFRQIGIIGFPPALVLQGD
jgi:hypothetical protein